VILRNVKHHERGSEREDLILERRCSWKKTRNNHCIYLFFKFEDEKCQRWYNDVMAFLL